MFFLTLLLTGSAVGGITVFIDPYMHFHRPLSDQYFYQLSSGLERSVNDGISRHFEYDSIITGSSMVENFMTSDAEYLFQGKFIKVPFEGARYEEVNDNLKRALRANSSVKQVIRCLDMLPTYWNCVDGTRTDMGDYPYYLNNDNPFDDIKYILNRDVLYKRVYGMIKGKYAGEEPGITDFNEYANWMRWVYCGKEAVLSEVFKEKENNRFTSPVEITDITDEERVVLRNNVIENITSLADEYPKVEFDYYFSPYSAAFWGMMYQEGKLERQIEAEKQMIELILSHSNIRLYSWNDRFDIICDLNNYKDPWHYAEWINAWILRQIYEDSGRLTQYNYMGYIDRIRSKYENMNYNLLFEQEDYSMDYIASVKLAEQITELQPLKLDLKLREKEHENGSMIEFCPEQRLAIEFYGRRVNDDGHPAVSLCDTDGNVLKEINMCAPEEGGAWQRYVIGISGLRGNVVLKMEGSFDEDNTQGAFLYKNVTVY